MYTDVDVRRVRRVFGPRMFVPRAMAPLAVPRLAILELKMPEGVQSGGPEYSLGVPKSRIRADWISAMRTPLLPRTTRGSLLVNFTDESLKMLCLEAHSGEESRRHAMAGLIDAALCWSQHSNTGRLTDIARSDIAQKVSGAHHLRRVYVRPDAAGDGRRCDPSESRLAGPSKAR